MSFSQSGKALAFCCFCLLILTFLQLPASGQMRQIYLDPDSTNTVNKLSFYAPNEGYVAFQHWIGYTTDSGRTFTKIYITNTNVNFNGYNGANYVYGFDITGVKAFNKDTLVAYGDYDLVPSILYSTDGGNTFTLVFWSEVTLHLDLPGITDLVFPQNDNIGYAIDADRILKTTNKGLTWTVLFQGANSYFNHIEAVDDNNLVVMCTSSTTNLLIKTSNGGSSWQNVTLPALPSGVLRYAFFLDANTGWLSMDNNSSFDFYKTTNGGASWIQLNDPDANPFGCSKMHFVDANTGYALVALLSVYKTLNGGVTWEPLPRDNSFSYYYFVDKDLQCWSPTQLWTGGPHGFLEITANGGGTPLPTAYFKIDTANVYATGTVNLDNYSRTGYSYQWFVNNVLVSTAYNASYTHVISSSQDSIRLIVTSGGISDTVTKYQSFFVPVLPNPSSFSPAGGGPGTYLTIKGSGFTNVTAVSVGGVPAASYTILSDTMITAIVANGASGNVTLTDIHGTYSLAGFTYYPPSASPPPAISSVVPAAGPVGTLVTISGSGFGGGPSGNGVYFGTVPAAILSASSTAIVCKVPPGASFGIISVLNRTDALTAQSHQPFNVGFADSSNFTPNSFAGVYSVAYNEYAYPGMAVGKDLDGDGKPDLAVNINSGGVDSLLVFLNTTAGGVLSLGPSFNVGVVGGNFDVDDVDGDGRPDIVSATNGITLILFKNTSTPGHLSFSGPVTVPVASGCQASVVTDLDNDGKNDIAVACFDQSYLSVMRNTGAPGLLAFGAVQNFSSGGNAKAIAAGDLDGDGKQDIVTFNYLSNNTTTSVVSCFRNTSSPGAISFALRLDLSLAGVGLQSGYVSIADYDGDGKPDLIVSNDGFYYVFLNTSTPGNLSFAPPVTVTLPLISQGVSLSNYSGSSRPDFVSGGFANRNFLLMRNISRPGTIANDSLLNLLGTYPYNPSIYFSNGTDFDLDGRTDIVLTGEDDHTFVILKNQIGLALPLQICTGAATFTTLSSDISGASYQWQLDRGTGFFAIPDNDSLSGTATNTLHFLNPSVSWTGYKYRCYVAGRYSSIYQLTVTGTVSPGVLISATDTSICYRNPVFFSATDGSGSTSYGFYWQVNGVSSGATTPFFDDELKDQDQVRVLMQYNDVCGNTHVDTSRAITMHVISPMVSVAASDSIICAGQPVTFTATTVGADSSVTFQWYVSTSGTQATTGRTITLDNLNSYSQVSVVMNASAMCPRPLYVSSNQATVVIEDSSAASVLITASSDTICAGSTAVFTATAAGAGLSPAYQWQVGGAGVGVDSAGFSSASLHNGDQVQCIVTSSSVCQTGARSGSNVVTMVINPIVKPSVTISPLDTSICAGEGLLFTATVRDGGSDPAYQWAINGKPAGTLTSYSSNTWTDGDVVTLYLTGDDACSSPDTATSIPTLVQVRPMPSITITGDTVIDPGAADQLIAHSSNTGTNPVYLWQDSTASHSWQALTGITGSSVNYNPLVGGDNVRCIVSSTDGCSATSNTLRLTVATVANAVRYYPNPAGPTLYVENMDPSDPFSTISIFSPAGNRLVSLQGPFARATTALDVSWLTTGTYFVRIERKSGKTNQFIFMKR
jgi:IPT/TIG domain/FG-GAP-like repeat/Secretion system C-terminal sorting domain/Photosynthesis system II assembly factor YCF48/PKD domain